MAHNEPRFFFVMKDHPRYGRAVGRIPLQSERPCQLTYEANSVPFLAGTRSVAGACFLNIRLSNHHVDAGRILSNNVWSGPGAQGVRSPTSGLAHKTMWAHLVPPTPNHRDETAPVVWPDKDSHDVEHTTLGGVRGPTLYHGGSWIK